MLRARTDISVFRYGTGGKTSETDQMRASLHDVAPAQLLTQHTFRPNNRDAMPSPIVPLTDFF